MNKRGIAELIADREGLPLAEGLRRVDQVLDAIVYGLVTDGYVGVTAFGAIEKVERAARTARNPQTGEAVPVPATVRVRLRPGKGLLELVSGERELPESGRAVKKAPKGTFTAVDKHGKAVAQ